jgi:hypothetical protein
MVKKPAENKPIAWVGLSRYHHQSVAVTNCVVVQDY